VHVVLLLSRGLTLAACTASAACAASYSLGAASTWPVALSTSMAVDDVPSNATACTWLVTGAGRAAIRSNKTLRAWQGNHAS
jgi:hypothetical protein